MSRADKTQTQITYELLLDKHNENILELEVAVLCAFKGSDWSPTDSTGIFSTKEHVAFKSLYTFDEIDETKSFAIPAEVVKLLTRR